MYHRERVPLQDYEYRYLTLPANWVVYDYGVNGASNLCNGKECNRVLVGSQTALYLSFSLCVAAEEELKGVRCRGRLRNSKRHVKVTSMVTRAVNVQYCKV